MRERGSSSLSIMQGCVVSYRFTLLARGHVGMFQPIEKSTFAEKHVDAIKNAWPAQSHSCTQQARDYTQYYIVDCPGLFCKLCTSVVPCFLM